MLSEEALARCAQQYLEDELNGVTYLVALYTSSGHTSSRIENVPSKSLEQRYFRALNGLRDVQDGYDTPEQDELEDFEYYFFRLYREMKRRHA